VNSAITCASSQVLAIRPCGTLRPMRSMAAVNSSRSSAILIERALAPINSTPYFSSTPVSDNFIATLSAVWPPIVGRSASGFSFAITISTYSGVTGSRYVRSAISGSVMIVAGFEFTRMTSYPSSRSARDACVPE
jgi:hypothetical protein